MGPAPHPQDRGREQLWGFHPGGDGGRAPDGGGGGGIVPGPDLQVRGAAPCPVLHLRLGEL